MADENINLPPGFQFYPTDEELVTHFLYCKAGLLPCNPDIIPDLDLHRYDPWELNGKALAGDNQWYFFSHRTQNRVSANGYWKSLGIDEPVTSGGKRVGTKKSLVYYIGEAPLGTKTSWIMHEYHLLDCGTSSRSSKRRGNRKTVSNEWVLCRVYDMNRGPNESFCDDGTELSCLDEVFLSLDDLEEISFPN
ncbi:NAC domain-containing protein 104-like [Tasmannia lanceolata]|uniref:NAC domain-containing protein 104-like n=1 Tax=Tasmannia lanceolata TaxID=3420 RepID=UPI0040634183